MTARDLLKILHKDGWYETVHLLDLKEGDFHIMLNLTYLAVLEPGTDGSYSVFFPDLPGCFSYGKNLDEAQRMAAEAASLHVYGLECEGEEIPTPSTTLSQEDTVGNVVAPILIHPDLFRMKKDNE